MAASERGFRNPPFVAAGSEALARAAVKAAEELAGAASSRPPNTLSRP